jgi:hypothetical protein
VPEKMAMARTRLSSLLMFMLVFAAVIATAQNPPTQTPRAAPGAAGRGRDPGRALGLEDADVTPRPVSTTMPGESSPTP